MPSAFIKRHQIAGIIIALLIVAAVVALIDFEKPKKRFRQ